MKKGFTVKLHGLENMRNILLNDSPKLAEKAMNNGTRALAAEFQKKVKKKVPVDEGTLKKSLKIKKRKSEKMKPVFENTAAFYWHFLEHGTEDTQPMNFVRESINETLSEMPDILEKSALKTLTNDLKKRLKNK